MPITTTPVRIIYNSPGSTVFPFPYLFEENSDLFCWQFTVATAALLPLNNGTDFTVSGAGVQAGGTVTLSVPSPTGTYLVIQRILPLTQQSSYDPNAGIPTSELNTDLDRLVMICQQLQDSMNRALVAPVMDAINLNLTLPTASLRANTLLAFDSLGQPISGNGIGTYRGNFVGLNNYSGRDLVRDGSTGNVYWVVSAYTASASIAPDISSGKLLLVFAVVANGNTFYGSFGTDTGTANTYVVSASPPIPALAAGTKCEFIVSNQNTGASTLNFNGLGIKSLVTSSNNPLASSAILAGTLVSCEYDGTVWRLTANSVVPPTGATVLESSSGNWVVPAGITSAKITLVAGGGGGGGCPATANTAAMGGHSGGVTYARVTGLVPGTSIPYIIGGLGTGGAPGANAGQAGGDTTIVSLSLSAKGGPGGAFGAAGVQTSFGTIVSGGGGYLAIYDKVGSASLGMTGANISGSGGATNFGVAGSSVSNSNGTSAQIGFGCGGAGGATTSAVVQGGGNGNQGCIIIEY